MEEIEDSTEEIWLPVRNWEGYYEVSNYGRVRSVERIVVCKDGKKRIIKSIILKQHYVKDGYLRVQLSKRGGQRICKQYRINRMVAETFIPNPYNLPEVDHINRVKTDNRVVNLRWCTRKENMRNRIWHTRGSVGGKPVLLLTKNGIFLRKYNSAREAARQTGISNSNISKWCSTNRKSKFPFIWKYASSR